MLFSFPQSILKQTGYGFLLLALSGVPSPVTAKWHYFRTGNPDDLAATPRGGFALMGGGAKQGPAFRYLCEHANGGDFLVLRANTEEDYAKKVDEEIKAICPLNSVATMVFEDREDSSDPKIPEIIARAEVIFFAGGDQSNYVRFWQDTPVEDALNRHIAAGKPIGGSSAGLAILGEFSFSSMIDTIHSVEALADPYGNKVTLSRDFLQISLLAFTITETHFVQRNRMGRLLVFMARILNDGWTPRVRAIAVDEDAAVLLEPDGNAKIVGEGPAYFLQAAKPPGVCRRKGPLRFGSVSVHRAPSGATFDIRTWRGPGGEDYSLSVENGNVTPSTSRKGIY